MSIKTYELRWLHEAATPGKWIALRNSSDPHSTTLSSVDTDWSPSCPECGQETGPVCIADDFRRIEDAELVAYVRNNILILIEAIEERDLLLDKLNRLYEERNYYRDERANQMLLAEFYEDTLREIERSGPESRCHELARKALDRKSDYENLV